MRDKAPEDGTRRIQTKFLWRRKSIKHEMRWLEMASWEERCVRWVNRYTQGGMGYTWEPVRWVDDVEELGGGNK